MSSTKKNTTLVCDGSEMKGLFIRSIIDLRIK